MRLLDQYLFRQTLAPLAFCVGGFLSLTIIIDLFGHLDEILKHRIPWRILVEYYLMYSPTIIALTLPLGVLLTVTFVLALLHRHNEITAMRASGISLYRIAAPFLVVGLLASTTIFLFSEYAIPPTTMRREQLRDQYFDAPPTDAASPIVEHITLLGRENRLYYVGAFDLQTQTLRDITILEHDAAHRLTGKLYARRAQWDGQRWLFSHGFQARLDPQGNLVGQVESFEERAMWLAEQPEHFAHPDIRPELMRFFQLRLYLDQLASISPNTRRRLEVDLAYKLSAPWTCVVMALLGIPCALRHRGGMLTGMGMSVLLGVVYYGVLAVSVALGKGGSGPAWLAVWSPHGLFAVVGLMALRRYV